jgi:hypothetical protein
MSLVIRYICLTDSDSYYNLRRLRRRIAALAPLSSQRFEAHSGTNSTASAVAVTDLQLQYLYRCYR